MKLRDFYPTLDALCEDLDISAKEIADTLKSVGYDYNKEQNKFI